MEKSKIDNEKFEGKTMWNSSTVFSSSSSFSSESEIWSIESSTGFDLAMSSFSSRWFNLSESFDSRHFHRWRERKSFVRWRKLFDIGRSAGREFLFASSSFANERNLFEINNECWSFTSFFFFPIEILASSSTTRIERFVNLETIDRRSSEQQRLRRFNRKIDDRSWNDENETCWTRITNVRRTTTMMMFFPVSSQHRSHL